MNNEKQNESSEVIEIESEVENEFEENVENKENVKNQQEQKSELKIKFEELKKSHDELNDKFLRTLAEYDNFRKRTIKEKKQIYPEVISFAVEQFLGVIDSLEAALKLEIKDFEFKKGFELIYENFKIALKTLNVKDFGVPGDIFDPCLHNAIIHVKDENFKDGEITEVLQKGYSLDGKVIRCAMVKVAN